jgi:serine/threonine protein kinase
LALPAGIRLGVYEVIAQIGEGGMGQVFRAHDTKLNRDVALKILPEAFATDPERLARFTREAQTLAALNHPHIAVRTWSRAKDELFYGRLNGQLMVVPLRVEGNSFRTDKPRLWSDGPFAWRGPNRAFRNTKRGRLSEAAWSLSQASEICRQVSDSDQTKVGRFRNWLIRAA